MCLNQLKILDNLRRIFEVLARKAAAWQRDVNVSVFNQAASRGRKQCTDWASHGDAHASSPSHRDGPTSIDATGVP